MSWSEPPSRRRVLLGLAAGLAAGLPAAGCGFQPLYGRPGPESVRAELTQIEVPPPSSRSAQLVYRPLVDRLNPTGRPTEKRYRLDLSISEGESGVLITRGDTTTRINLTLIAGFNLVDLQSGKSLFTGTARSVASYNVLTSDFANLTGYADARERAAQEVAEQIALRLGVFFSDPSKA